MPIGYPSFYYTDNTLSDWPWRIYFNKNILLIYLVQLNASQISDAFICHKHTIICSLYTRLHYNERYIYDNSTIITTTILYYLNLSIISWETLLWKLHHYNRWRISKDNTTSNYMDLDIRIWNIVGLGNINTQLLYTELEYMLNFTISMEITTVSPTISHILLLQLLYRRFYSTYRLIHYYCLRYIQHLLDYNVWLYISHLF